MADTLIIGDNGRFYRVTPGKPGKIEELKPSGLDSEDAEKAEATIASASEMVGDSVYIAGISSAEGDEARAAVIMGTFVNLSSLSKPTTSTE